MADKPAMGSRKSNKPLIVPFHRAAYRRPHATFVDTRRRARGAQYRCLVKNKDNDPWKGNAGEGGSKVWVTFSPAKNRFSAVGPGSRGGVHTLFHPFSAATEASQAFMSAGDKPAERIPEFVNLVRAQKCCAKDDSGVQCKGRSISKAKKQIPRGHKFWVVCSGWTPDSGKHRSWTILDDDDENLFIKGLLGEPPVEGNSKNTALYISYVHPTTGLKQRRCPMRRHKKALIVHPHNVAHNHPMPALKASFEAKNSYRKCVETLGPVEVTGTKIITVGDLLFYSQALSYSILPAASTHVLLGGKTPAEYAPALPSACIQAFLGRYEIGPDEKYIHRLVTLPDALMKLLDGTAITSFKTDTAFRRVAGDIRPYDEFQGELTGKPFALKRFVKGGNLIALNSGMEAARVLSAARSLFKFNDREHSRLGNDAATEDVAPEIVILCTTHAKRRVYLLHTKKPVALGFLQVGFPSSSRTPQKRITIVLWTLCTSIRQRNSRSSISLFGVWAWGG
ncbi:hypothetical protein C8J57DRAFT_1623603 [Mycena rebaudengoi]|nr:hypothetical protein C8J57DRAFT_1623603 [Mycena rebaudengoi]